MKVPTAVVPPGGPVVCPKVVKRLDYEGELVVVIGEGSEIAGYAIADDVSARDLQKREPQWTRAKGVGHVLPVGPVDHDRRRGARPARAAPGHHVNGEVRQDSSTSRPDLRAAGAGRLPVETITLEPGDIILTGTPAGVGTYFDPPKLLNDGDVVRIEIEGLGAIEHPVEIPGCCVIRPDASPARPRSPRCPRRRPAQCVRSRGAVRNGPWSTAASRSPGGDRRSRRAAMAPVGVRTRTTPIARVAVADATGADRASVRDACTRARDPGATGSTAGLRPKCPAAPRLSPRRRAT